MSTILSLNNITVSYKNKNIIENLSLCFKNNGLYTLLGANGSGKSTILKAILGDKTLNVSGDIIIKGNKNSNNVIAEHIAFLPQSLNVSFAYKSIEIVMMGHRKYTNNFLFSKDIREDALNCFNILKIEHLINRKISELSGGEKALVFIAKLICKNTDIFLLDEPDSALDFSYRIKLFEKLLELKKNKLIIITSHDPYNVSLYSDYIIPVLKNGHIEIVDKNNFNSSLIRKIYSIDDNTPVHFIDNLYKQYT